MKLINEEELWNKLTKYEEDQFTFDVLEQILDDCTNQWQTEWKKRYIELVELIAILIGQENRWSYGGTWFDEKQKGHLIAGDEMNKELIKILMEWKNNGWQ